MPTASQQKRCRVCGNDVSQAKRTKDEAGDYYCEPCVQAHRSGSTAKVCANCGTAVGALQQLWDWNGHRVCTGCRDALRHETELRQEEEQAVVAAQTELADCEDDADKAAFRAERTRQHAGLLRVVWLCLLTSGLPAAAFMTWQLSPLVGLMMLAGMGLMCFGLVKQYRAVPAAPAGKIATDFKTALNLYRVRVHVIAWETATCVMVLALFAVAGVTCERYGMLWAWVAGGIALVPVIICGAFAQRALSKECPLCWTSGTVVFDGVEDLGAVEVTTRTYEKATVHEGLNTFGLPLATIKMPVEKTRLVRRQAQNWHCTACGHRWRK